MSTQTITIGLVVFVLLGASFYFFVMPDDAMMENKNSVENESMMKKDDAMMKDEGVMQKDESMKDESMMKKEEGAIMATKGTIETYSPEKLALAQEGKVVLFFHANWCPICRQLDAEAAANSNIVPDGVHVLKVDYDTATALKKKYGVTVQHTFVQVDPNGNQLGKWSDATTYSQVFAKVK